MKNTSSTKPLLSAPSTLKTLILLLANKGPRSFISGALIDLGPVLQAYNREEFHHLMPRSFLKDKGRSTTDINRLANFAIISAMDNKILGGDAPSAYRKKMPAETIDDILTSAICPNSLFDDEYDVFIRAQCEVARRLCQIPHGLENDMRVWAAGGPQPSRPPRLSPRQLRRRSDVVQCGSNPFERVKRSGGSRRRMSHDAVREGTGDFPLLEGPRDPCARTGR